MSFISVENNILNYAWFDYKRSQTLILINSLGTNLLIWQQMISTLTDDFNILLHDKRGHGMSIMSDNLQPSIDDYANDVIALMDHCQISKAHIVGLSIGGLVAFSLVSRYPNRVDKLIFSNTGTKLGTKESWIERIHTIEMNGLASISDDVMKRWFSKIFFVQKHAEIQGYTHMLQQTSQNGYLAACSAIAKADYSKHAKHIDKDVLFIGGSEDIATPPSFVKENAQLVNDSKYIEFIGVGHLPCIEVPLEFAIQLKNFIL